MKKILSLVLCVVMLATFALVANAEALNLAGGYTTDVVIKKAAVTVVKDGVIKPGEYEELVINRNTDETSTDPISDLLLSWVDSQNGNMLVEQCCEFLQNVHYYFSWDETNGLNIAIKAKLLETPYCSDELPAAGAGDEFVFDFGAVFAFKNEKYKDMYNPKNDLILYRGIGYNTVENKKLIGDYGAHGLVETKFDTDDFEVVIDGNWVTYEISFPLNTILEASAINGKAPVADTKIDMNVSATGGGNTASEAAGQRYTYCVSLGDYGFMQSKFGAENPSSAIGIFSLETVSGAPVVTTSAATTEPETQIVTSVVTEEVEVTDEAGNTVTDEFGNVVTEVVENVVTEIVTVPSTTPGAGTQSPTTGDPMIIAAVVAAISACGIVVAKKRK